MNHATPGTSRSQGNGCQGNGERINELQFAECDPEPTEPTPNPSQEGNAAKAGIPVLVPLLRGVRGGLSRRFMGSAIIPLTSIPLTFAST